MRTLGAIVLVGLLLLPLAAWTVGGLPWCCLGASCPMAAAAMPHCSMQMQPRCGVSANPPLALPTLTAAVPPAAVANGTPAPRRHAHAWRWLTAATVAGWQFPVFNPPKP